MTSKDHPHGQNPFVDLPRCGAKNRRGSTCQRPAGPKGRCYYHGGAPGSGAPRGKKNGRYRHGKYTQEAIADRKLMRELLNACGETLSWIDDA